MPYKVGYRCCMLLLYIILSIIMIKTLVMIEIKIVLGGHIHDNNTVVNISDIGEQDEALLCYTNATDRCKNAGQLFVRGWYFPSGVAVKISDYNDSIYRNRDQSVVRLNRRNNATSPSGVFRCAVPDANGTSQSIYVGIYPEEGGILTITEPPNYSFDHVQIITCTSKGGPATNVEWLKDGQILGHKYEQQKRIVNQITAEYQSILSLGQSTPDEIIGKYTCRVNNARGGANETIHLHGS